MQTRPQCPPVGAPPPPSKTCPPPGGSPLPPPASACTRCRRVAACNLFQSRQGHRGGREGGGRRGHNCTLTQDSGAEAVLSTPLTIPDSPGPSVSRFFSKMRKIWLKMREKMRQPTISTFYCIFERFRDSLLLVFF